MSKRVRLNFFLKSYAWNYKRCFRLIDSAYADKGSISQSGRGVTSVCLNSGCFESRWVTGCSSRPALTCLSAFSLVVVINNGLPRKDAGSRQRALQLYNISKGKYTPLDMKNASCSQRISLQWMSFSFYFWTKPQAAWIHSPWPQTLPTSVGLPSFQPKITSVPTGQRISKSKNFGAITAHRQHNLKTYKNTNLGAKPFKC